MPYTIRTKDGIEIPDVPDNIAADSPEARALVQAARAKQQSGSAPVQPSSPTADEAYSQHEATKPAATGAALPRGVRGAMTAGQGLTLNFLDELGGAAALGQLGQSYAMGGTDTPPTRADYTSARDLVRGGVEQFKQESPGAAMGLEIAGGIPTMFVGGGGAVTLGQRMAQALKTGGAFGGASGAGASEADTLGGVAGDALTGASIGGGLGAAGSGAGGVLSAVGRRSAAALGSQRTAQDLARERLAKVLTRTLPDQFQPGGQFQQRVESRLGSLGQNAPLAAVGPEAVAELDVLANMPGTARRGLNVARREIQSGRGPALVGAAEEALRATGRPFRQTLEGFVIAKQDAARPFYEKLQNATVTVDKELIDLLERSERAHGVAKELAKVGGTKLPKLSSATAGQSLPFDSLDTVKKALWDIAEGAKGEFGRSTERSRAYHKLRRELIDKLDASSPVDSFGRSIYRTARETFESGAQLETAMRRGADAMSEKVDDLRSIMNDMDATEVEAFRLGAAQALRDKLGTQAGQTQVLNLYKEPTLQAKLKVVFGNDFNKFRRAVLQQEQIKEVERAGRNSQTFARGAQAEDMGAFMGAVDTAQATKTGDVSGLIKRGVSALSMPEPVRNELSRMLLKKGFAAKTETQQAQALAARSGRRRIR